MSKWKARSQILTRDAFGTPKLVSAPARLHLSSHAQQVWLSMFYVSPENYLYNFGKFWLIGFARIRKENWPTNPSAALLDENFTEQWTRLLFYFYGNWNRNHLPILFSHHLDFLFNFRPTILFVLMSSHVMQRITFQALSLTSSQPVPASQKTTPKTPRRTGRGLPGVRKSAKVRGI